MRPSTVGALFVLLGIILLQVTSAEKIGSCPHVYVRCSSVNNTCKIDEDCLRDQKCCEICGYNCEDPVAEKPGSCPNIQKCDKPIENTCKNDQDCEEDEKCCDVCGYNCQKPVPDKEGECQFYETFAPCTSITRECEGDAFCPDKQKCCNVYCTMKCDDPQYKPGTCPNIKANCASVKNTCKSDQDCDGNKKCCNLCGYNCQKPVPDKPGSCPNIMAKCAFIKNTCKSDQDCDGNKKCCNMCGYNCQKPVPDKKGQCKLYETFAPCRSINRKCQGDAFCPGKQKCCNVQCTMKCDDPKSEKNGQCPHVGIPNTHAFFVCRKINTTACKTDEECGGQQKCCSEYCVNKCKDPVVVKPGSCPTGKLNCPMLKPNSSYNNMCAKDSDCDGKKKCCNKCGLKCEDPQ
ncbi:uncharacterized protein LOC143986826 [Lithobates pipiens]